MLPPSQRNAIIMLRIKKQNADPTNVKKYWSISNLTFASKLFKRLVCRQLMAFLEQENFLPVRQWAYRKYHSTETAILKIISNALLAADRGEITLLKLLDLGNSTLPISAEITCLGVVLDNEMKFDTYRKRLSGRCLYYLRHLRTIRHTITVDEAKTLINCTGYQSHSA